MCKMLSRSLLLVVSGKFRPDRQQRVRSFLKLGHRHLTARGHPALQLYNSSHESSTGGGGRSSLKQTGNGRTSCERRRESLGYIRSALTELFSWEAEASVSVGICIVTERQDR